MPKKRSDIDKKILPLIDALNRAGLPATGSCEGHIDNTRAPAPWVKITPKTLSAKESKNLRKKAEVLLKKFYKNRHVWADVRFTIEDGTAGFWIHNGGKDYRAWRREVESRVEQHKKKMPPINKKLNDNEEKEKTIRLKRYQAEIKPFVKFLLGLHA